MAQHAPTGGHLGTENSGAPRERRRRWLAGLTALVLVAHAAVWMWWRSDSAPTPVTLHDPATSQHGSTLISGVQPPPLLPAPGADIPLAALRPVVSVIGVGQAPATPPPVSPTAPPATSQAAQSPPPPRPNTENAATPVGEPPAPVRELPRAHARPDRPTDATSPPERESSARASAAPPLPGSTVAEVASTTSHPAPALAAGRVAASEAQPPASPGPPDSAAAAAPSTSASVGPTDADTTHPKRVAVPADRELSFQVRASRKGLSLPARSTLSWHAGPDGYRARLLIQSPLARDRSQTSVGQIDPVLGLRPQRFGDKNRSEVATHFDRSRTPPVIRFSSNAPDAPLLPGAQDRLSVLIQLGAMLAGEPERYARGHRIALYTAGPRNAELWTFDVLERGTLELPVGTLETLHLKREPLSAYDNRVEVWLAPALDYLPVRLLWIQANGDVVDQQLSATDP